MDLPTLYDYYNSSSIKSGLTTKGRQFKLNGKDIWLYSGAVHYFRVPKPYWRDRLRKLRAAGLNTVETYIPWNLHEYQNGSYDFGGGGSDMEDFLDVKEFLKIAQEEDLFALVRPGPYICSEWDFGGLPSWLLSEDIKVRTSDKTFMKYVERYFNILLPILDELQYTKGGPIIGFQIENEYGSTEENGRVDNDYLYELKTIFERNGLIELFFTSDGISIHGSLGSIPGVLSTSNFQSKPEFELDALVKTQPDKPVMCMEYWTGWVDHWSEKHHVRTNETYADVLERILKYPASVNLYMFHGGTNWGFMNGANVEDNSSDNKGFQPDTTSYDYDAPLAENGDYTEKYIITKRLIDKYNKIRTKLPEEPKEIMRYKYNDVKITEMLSLSEIIDQSVCLSNSKLLPMEKLGINNNSGQSYGYVIYRTKLDIPAGGVLKIIGHVCDTLMVVVNGKLISKPLTQNSDLDGFGYWKMKDSSIILSEELLSNATLDLVVENWGRVNFGGLKHFKQYKGLWQGPVIVNDRVIDNWDIIPLEFKRKWTNSLINWEDMKDHVNPSIYKGVLEVSDLYDTYIDMRGWCKGVVIVNGFVLGRHAVIGPQMTLYLPAPLLKKGSNEIIIFEHFKPNGFIEFSKDPIFTEYTNDMPF